MATDSKPDRAALKAWYAANFQPAEGSESKPVKPTKPITRPPPEFEKPAVANTSASNAEEKLEAAAERRAALDITRNQARKKSLRWRLAVFCFMLAGTVVAAVAIYLIIQHKFGGKIPYF